MRKALAGGLIVCLIVFCASVVAGAEGDAQPAGDKAKEERQAKAKAAATAWCDALFQGDVAKVMALSATPFCWDGKTILETTEELEANLKKATEKKGARDLKSQDATIVSDKSETVEGCVPNDRIVVKLTVKGEGILVCVRPGKEFKVVGFRD